MMLTFLGKELKKDFDYNFIQENISDFVHSNLGDGDKDFVYLKPVQLLNANFSIYLSFRNKILTGFTLHSRELKYEEAASFHVKWLEENFGQYKTWVGREKHYITDEYDFYEYYDPRSGSAEILCKVLR
ncbi:MAG: hypothetical protein K6F69_05300 [Treponema sp.]|nr:hypothetical protein [Treponema sp.]